MKKFLFSISLLIVLSFNFSIARGQDVDPAPLDASDTQEIVDSIVSQYYDWDSISMSGKLSSPILPITASVKIYMEKGQLMIITVSAPLIGEAARIEVDRDQLLIVNKYKNTYATVDTDMIEPILPGGLDALQNLMLGRITILGSGQLSSADAPGVQIYDASEDLWMLLPNQDIQSVPFVYFYVLDKFSLLLERFAVIPQGGDGEADIFYEWNDRNLTLDMEAVFGGKGLDATLRLNNPDSTPKPISRFAPSAKFRQTDIKGVMKM